MINGFEYKGYWYLPSDPEHKVAGILSYVPNESITLELIGSFEKSKTGIISSFEKERVDFILGITSDAHEVSLINCFPNGGRMAGVVFKEVAEWLMVN